MLNGPPEHTEDASSLLGSSVALRPDREEGRLRGFRIVTGASGCQE